jgi:hypothetical protein
MAPAKDTITAIANRERVIIVIATLLVLLPARLREEAVADQIHLHITTPATDNCR